MAITLITLPQQFHPLNAAIYKVASNRPTIQSFRVRIIDFATNAIIATQLYSTLPMSPLGATFDLASLLSSTVDNQVNTSPIIENVITKGVKAYTLSITEFYLNNGVRTEGDTFTTAQRIVFNARLSRPAFSSYDFTSLVVLEGNPAAKFLSLRPLVNAIFPYSTVNLYFLTNHAGKVRIRFYKNGNVLVGEQIVNFSNANLHMLNLSPVAMQSYFGDAIFNMYGKQFSAVFTSQFGSVYNINDANYFTVQVLSTSNVIQSELRTFQMIAADCRRKVTEVLFFNNLGGMDSMSFYEPRQTLSVTKNSIEMNTLLINSTGDYYDSVDGVYNGEEKTIKTASSNTFSIFSDPLTNETAVYAKSLLESENVFVKLSDGKLLPIQIIANEYLVYNRKYSTENTRLSISFRVNDINFSL